MKRDNINVILCEKIDDSLKNITNISDVISMDENENISFTAVVFINGIEWEVEKFGLYYFLVNVDSNKIAFIGSSDFINDKEEKKRSNGSSEYSKHNNSAQAITDMRFEELYVPGKGNYELQIYKYENDEIVDLSNEDMSKCIQYAKDEKIVSSYAFEVV